ncbi:MAG: hypothetical protein JST00_04010 [Deltaproteobacteria bacterium]|nr:hypothetical protein [Deltaproteobacteria bacterium]
MVGRRDFVRSVLAALTLAHFTPGCSSDEPEGGGTTPPTPDPPIGDDLLARWKRLREAIAKSPDNLAARAAALVAAKDSRGLFALFRDAIRTVPPFGESESIETAMRHGPGSILRIGAGTPRERAELLASLLVRAGFAARVVKASPDGALAKPDAQQKVYGRVIDLPFDPGPPPPGGWGPASPAPIELLDADGREAQALFDRIRPVLPAGDARLPTLPSFSGMPFVALEEAGRTVYLNPLLADAVYGESYASGTIEPAAPPAPVKKVSIKLSMTRVRDPKTPIELVARELGFDEIAGARLRVSPQPTLPLAVVLQSKPSDVTSFVATLSLFSSAGVHLSTVAGKSVSAFGDVAVVQGEASSSGIPLARGGNASAVTSVEVKASARAFPSVELEIAAKDAGGKVVRGLSASSFAIEEEGKGRSATLRENGGGPRVLVVWDGTGSQPVPDATLGAAIGKAIFDAMPDARVQVTLLGGSPSANGFTLADAAAVGSALAGVSEVASPVWNGLVAAINASPSLVVVFTDGDAEKIGDFEARRARALACVASTPVVAIGCATGGGTVSMDVIDAIAAASGGKSVQAGDLSDPSLALAAIGEVGARRSSAPYRLVYRADRGGPPSRAVKVTVLGAPAAPSASATYAVPATSGPDSDAHGLHLTIDVAGRTVTRTLAGLPIGVDPSTKEEIASASASVHDFMLGTSWLTMEAGAPTLSAWIDDALGAAIDFYPVSEAARRNDVARTYELATTAKLRPLLSSFLAHARLFSPADATVLEVGPRLVLHQASPVASRFRLDILPTTRFASILAPSGTRAFDAVLLSSLRLAVAESKVLKGSTSSSLASRPLKLLPLGALSLSDVPAGVPEGERPAFLRTLNAYADWQRVVATDGTSRAFWAIDPQTGSALGILPDASGGAVQDCKALVDTINTLMDELVFLVQQLEGGVAAATIAVAAVGKAAAIAVAEAALSFTDPLIDPSIWKLGAILACEAGKQVISNVLPGGGSNIVTKNAEDAAKSMAADALLGGDPICKAAAPCTSSG